MRSAFGARGEISLKVHCVGCPANPLYHGRSSSVDLLRKMVAAEFRRNLKTYDQVESLWKLLLTARGQVSDIVCPLQANSLFSSQTPALKEVHPDFFDHHLQVLDASLVLFLALLARDGRALEPIFIQNGDRLSSLICRTMQAHEDADGFALERKSRHSKGKVKNRSLLNMVSLLDCMRLGHPEYSADSCLTAHQMADLRKAWLEAELGGPEVRLVRACRR